MRGRLRRAAVLFWRLSVHTTKICLRYRVTGLAAEAGFFALLSLPPLVLGLVGAIGFVGQQMGTEVVADLRSQLRQLTLTFLTADSVSSVILPTFDRVVGAGRADIVSIGFLLSLWSGSRVLNVYVDTVSMMYGMGGLRGIIRTRALSFSLYVAGLIVGVVVIPLVLIGPGILARVLNSADLDVVALLSQFFYWPTVSVVALAALATLYHIATPIRSPWRRDLPGAVLALIIWVLASFILRWVIARSVGGTSIYGPLSTPIVVLIWLYFLAIAVLIGAALNAAIDERYPTEARILAREQREAREELGLATTVPLTPNRAALIDSPDVAWPAADDVPPQAVGEPDTSPSERIAE
ncbi:MAG TPA: YihY/virulence factor BrkB family protein [Kineosporiaceae bacterium]|nr:YihY/virulence factor BrkB family protein [Kineosporiaceae bacterium]